MKPGDAVPAALPETTASPVDAPSVASPEASDDRAMRRAALRDLAAMIGVEVFY